MRQICMAYKACKAALSGYARGTSLRMQRNAIRDCEAIESQDPE